MGPMRESGEPADRHAQHRVVAVIVDGSPQSGAALRHAASQARQRNALLDIVCIVPEAADSTAFIMARVKLGEFTRRECPYGMGVPVRLRVEYGEPPGVLRVIAAEAELLISGLPPAPDDEPSPQAETSAAPRHRHWVRALIPASST